MAKKSKTQRAKASAARAARKEAKAREAQRAAQEGAAEAQAEQTEAPKKGLFKKADKSDDAQKGAQAKKSEKKGEKKPKKQRFKFFKDVKAEMKRVTWPTRQDVIRWSGVVVVALLFFGIFAFAFDSISTWILAGISGLGAS